MNRHISTTLQIGLLILLVAQAAPASAAPASAAPRSWPFRDEGRPWHHAMNPTAATIVLNDRVAKFPKLGEKKATEALETFKEAVSSARVENAAVPCPDVLVVALCNLAAFQYRLHNDEASLANFNEALRIATEHSLSSSQIVDILEDAAVVYRDCKNFDMATQLYERALALKKVDARTVHHGMSHSNLAAVAHDRGDMRAVEHHHSETHAAVGGKEFVSSAHTPNERRPNSTSGFEKPKEYLPEMLAEANSIIALVKERQLSRQQEELMRREIAARKAQEAWRKEQIRRQKIADALNATSTDAEIAPPFADVAGKVIYPIPDQTEFRVTNALGSEKTIAHDAPAKADKGKKAEAVPVDIVLCKYEVRDALARYLIKASKDKTQPIEELGTTWPATKLQARPMLGQVIQIAMQYKLNKLPDAVNASNTEGEFIFRGVPKGEFFVFAPLPCKSEYLFWLVPVSVSDKKEVTIDLVRENVAHYLWTDRRDLKAVNADLQANRSGDETR